jgi:hypothetical protein
MGIYTGVDSQMVFASWDANITNWNIRYPKDGSIRDFTNQDEFVFVESFSHQEADFFICPTGLTTRCGNIRDL